MRYFIPLLIFAAPLFASHPLFDLGPKWQIVDPRQLQNGHFDYMFLNAGHSIAGLRLILAHEPISGSLDEYLAACIKLNQESPGTKARRLGPYTTKRGLKGELLEVEADGMFGRMTTLQLITERNKVAYVLTITTDKKSFLKEQKTFMEIFNSFWFSEDPINDCLDPKIAKSLKDHLTHFNTAALEIAEKAGVESAELFAAWRASPDFCDKLWPRFARLIEKHFAKLGPIWQLEVLKWCANQIQNFSFAEKKSHGTLKEKGRGCSPPLSLNKTKEISAI